MEPSHPVTMPGFYDRNRVLLKAMLIGALILLMLIPVALIHNLVVERSERQQQVNAEVSRKWAKEQTITGPVLIVPYNYSYPSAGGKTITLKKWAHFLPDDLRIDGEVRPEVRHRSRYNVTFYQSDLHISGQFNPLSWAALQINLQDVLWSEARLLLGINDTRGLQEQVTAGWNDTNPVFEAGMPENNVLKNGLSAPVVPNQQGMNKFDFRIRLRGSESLGFSPVGKVTHVAIRSAWPHPEFTGPYINTSDITPNKGFNAHWQILQSGRPYPQSWKDDTPDLYASAFGVRLIQPVNGYVKTERSVKYAVLFIALTFAVFFFLELIQKRQVHPLQYLLVGLALTIFYTLLLSVSEYLGFDQAYLIAAAATVSLIGSYVWSMFRNGKMAIGFTLALAGLYSYIFILIQLEEFALLFGSTGLFIMLAVIMFYSRKVDWYRVSGHEPVAQP